MIWFCIFAVCTFLTILFQWALAFGAPWGEYAMGGKYPGKFPKPIRMAAIIQSFVLLFLLFIISARSKLAFTDWYSFSLTASWFVVGFATLALILNLITPSKKERMIWAPVCFLMLLSSVMIALKV